jgi:hypothetical protein
MPLRYDDMEIPAAPAFYAHRGADTDSPPCGMGASWDTQTPVQASAIAVLSAIAGIRAQGTCIFEAADSTSPGSSQQERGSGVTAAFTNQQARRRSIRDGQGLLLRPSG